jgi:hypothetical protein
MSFAKLDKFPRNIRDAPVLSSTALSVGTDTFMAHAALVAKPRLVERLKARVPILSTLLSTMFEIADHQLL